jgi:hypothetical protein
MENLTDFDKQILLEQLRQGLKNLEQELIDLDVLKLEINKKIEGVMNLIFKIENQETKENTGKRTSLLKGQDFTWKTISIEILKDKRRLFTTDEIYSEFIIIKPEFSDHDKKRNIQASFSSALAQLAESKEMVKIDRKYGKGNYWALPDWFGLSGSPLPEFTEQFERLQIADFKYKHHKDFIADDYFELRP